MAKIFATYLKDNEVVLETWSSAKAFEKSEQWTDNKFILIASTDDFKGKASFPLDPMYTDKLIEPDSDLKSNGFNITHTENERTAHNLLVEVRNKYLNIKSS